MSPADPNSPLFPGTHRVALALACLTGALLFVGGLVTTYRVGMAVTDWPTTFGYSMFTYPLDEMLADFGVTLEHSHRLLASTVGLLSLVLVLVASRHAGRAVLVSTGAAVLAELTLVAVVIEAGGIGGALQMGLLAAVITALALGLVFPQRRGARAAAGAVHLAVIGQGLLGGTRVLENSQELAFLHGSVAQFVFLLMVLAVVTTSGPFLGAVDGGAREPAAQNGGAQNGEGAARRGLLLFSTGATVLVFAQIVLGAWLRHTGRSLPLMLHIAFALAVIAALLLLAGALRRGAACDPTGVVLRRLRLRLHLLLGLQILIGLGTLAAIELASGGFQGRVTTLEALAASTHVVVGALLLGTCAAAGVWGARLLPRKRQLGAHRVEPVLEGSAVA